MPKNSRDAHLEGDAIVATRREPKLVRARFLRGEAQGVENFVTGFQQPDGRRWARPVGVGFGPDGTPYFTSDSGTEGLFRLSPSATDTTGAGSPGSAP